MLADTQMAPEPVRPPAAAEAGTGLSFDRPRRICAVVNADGGTVRAGGIEAADLAAAFLRHGIEAEVRLVPGEHVVAEAERARAEVLAGRLDAVIVGGGDGTVGTVAGILADSGVVLGVLPLGTLNHFAKDLGLDQDLDGAIATIAAGRLREVDLGEVNGRTFVNNSSVGIYPYMVVDRDRRRSETGQGKWPAMALAFLRMLRRFPRRRLRVQAEGWAAPHRTICLFVGNNPYSIELMTLGRRFTLDSGRLWLFVAKQRSRLELLRFALRAAIGRIDQERDFETLCTGSLRILMRASRVHVAVDGEVTTMRPPLDYRIRPRALRVLAPAAA